MTQAAQDPVVVRYLRPDEPSPKSGDDDPWLSVEPFDNDGKFYGSGASRKSSGEDVIYASLAENDISLEKAISAAREWAKKYNVPVIYVRTEPEIEYPRIAEKNCG